jgi:FkbM family methyltransferase
MSDGSHPPMETLPVSIGTKTYVLTSDDDYLHQLKGGFEPDMVHLFECLLRKDFCVADVGANIGCTSILFGELAARVISFEPSPSTFRDLQQNIRRAGLANVELCNYGLGAQRGDTKLTFSANNRAGAFISGDMKTSSGHVVEAVHIETLDDVIDGLGNARLDFIKIDAEGFEKDVIEGARDVISRDEPLIVLELNHWCLNAFRRIAVPDFLDYLRSIFPLLYAVENTRYLDLHDEAESYIVMYHHINHGRYKNLLAAFGRTELAGFHSRFAHMT